MSIGSNLRVRRLRYAASQKSATQKLRPIQPHPFAIPLLFSSLNGFDCHMPN